MALSWSFRCSPEGIRTPATAFERTDSTRDVKGRGRDPTCMSRRTVTDTWSYAGTDSTTASASVGSHEASMSTALSDKRRRLTPTALNRLYSGKHQFLVSHTILPGRKRGGASRMVSRVHTVASPVCSERRSVAVPVGTRRRDHSSSPITPFPRDGCPQAQPSERNDRGCETESTNSRARASAHRH